MRYFILLAAVLVFASCGDSDQKLTPEEFISQRNITATKLDSGVYIIIKNPGNDVKPNLQNVVNVRYEGRLTDDTVFDSNEDFKAILEDLIPGWIVGLKEIGEGGSCTLIIPYQMGFGSVTNGPVPAQSTLVFDIELIEVFETLTMEEYIEENDLETQILDQGVQIVVHEPGNENKPTLESDLIVNYVGMLTNTLIFDQALGAPVRMSNIIEGWRIGLQEIGEGGVCTLIVPSEVAYGEEGSGIIPPNAVLVFEIELIQVF